ncbi:MAG: rane protein, partial [Chitinophagaceae bacterium]|nr:rane protein [Chitinophagaceae bacterium]
LGESFELVAIKSSGISLFRFMMPLLVVAILISGVSFLFSNNIIPIANLKLESLKVDLIQTKPALDIKEGVFYNKIEGYVIKLGKKEKDDSTIRDIIIYEKSFNLQDHMMTAESGIMRVTPDKKFLEFTLRNGWRYEEKGNRGTTNTEFIRLGFKEYKKLFDLASFQMQKTPDSLYEYHHRMLSIRQLNQRLDSFAKSNALYLERNRREINPHFRFAAFMDSAEAKALVQLPAVKADSFKQLIPESYRTLISERANSQLNATVATVDMLAQEQVRRDEEIRNHKIEWHRKFSLSFACILLFMIGAPLGSIIRKGGLGTPLVFALIFFIFFHLFNTFGEKFVKENVTSAVVGMWLSTMVLVPIGAFLTYKAMHDSQLFSKEFYHRFFRSTRRFLAKFKLAKRTK